MIIDLIIHYINYFQWISEQLIFLFWVNLSLSNIFIISIVDLVFVDQKGITIVQHLQWQTHQIIFFWIHVNIYHADFPLVEHLIKLQYPGMVFDHVVSVDHWVNAALKEQECFPFPYIPGVCNLTKSIISVGFNQFFVA